MMRLKPVSFLAFWVFAILIALSSCVPEQNETILKPFSSEEQEQLKAGSERHEFQAEVHRLMDIIINSLYGQKEVFARELLSNSADALEKIRFISVSDPSVLEANPNFEIRVEVDKDAQTLTIQDTGVGMTKQELINNLGTVARSGTTNFLEALSSGMDLNLIGQFGLGFYSAFLVADKVTVISKSYADPVQHVWESSADASFSVAADPRGNTLGRGTRVVLHLKDDSTAFLNPSHLQEVVTKFNQFINFPIFVKLEKKRSEEVPIDTKIEGDLEEDKTAVQPEPKEGEEKPKTKKVKRKYLEWEQVNKQKPIWLRPKESISEEEYNQFYKDVLRDYSDPTAYIHFTAEGEVEFKSILYIPPSPPRDNWQSYFRTKQRAVQLYSRRILVADETFDLIPQWLNFIKGVVDSDDLPLKVDRESFAQTKMMKVITKKLVAKFVEMVRKLSKEDTEAWEKYREESNYGADKNVTVPKTKFGGFWNTFSKNMKLGCIEDEESRDKISSVFRWHTTKTSMNDSITMDEYVARMPEEQKEILFVANDNYDAALQSPHVQLYKKKGWELIVAHDPLDENCLTKINSFRTKSIVSIEKTNVKSVQTDDEKKHFKKVEKAYKPLTAFLEKRLGSKIGRVKVSAKLVEDPAAITTDSYGHSAYHERLVKAQSFSAYQSDVHNKYRVLEINPNHPLITKLLDLVKTDKDDPQAEALADTLLDTAMLASGFTIVNPRLLVTKLVSSLRQEAGVPTDAVVEDFVLPDVDNEDLKEGDYSASGTSDQEEDFDADEDYSEEDASEESGSSDSSPHDEL